MESLDPVVLWFPGHSSRCFIGSDAELTSNLIFGEGQADIISSAHNLMLDNFYMYG